jgi:tRNA-specific 2-thiouridylase
MSGGVDSSVAAYLLKREGYDVIGLTMKIWQEECVKMHAENCCGPRAVADVRNVCHKLGIPFYILNYENEFRKEVISYFCSEYGRGRTPNPCTVCNDRLKFGLLINKARELGAEKVASGHYAVIEERLTAGGGRYVLKKGKDPEKDQSYFLCNLNQEQLGAILFPVGGMKKSEVRALARELGLPVHGKPDSVEVCFIPDNDYKSFLKREKIPLHPGKFVTTGGKVVGSHEGIELYTVGQRKGIGISAKEPYYVVRIDTRKHAVIVGDNNDLFRKDFIVKSPNWISCDPPTGGLRVETKIRYNSPAVPGTIVPAAKGIVKAVFDEPQRAVTPGQCAVFYQGDDVVGGGWIF